MTFIDRTINWDFTMALSQAKNEQGVYEKVDSGSHASLSGQRIKN